MEGRVSKLIIVEGIDSSGKSSLSRRISHSCKMAYMHASGHKLLHDAMYPYHRSLLSDALINLDNGLGVVMDRHWPSEYAYGSVLRPVSLARYDFVKTLEEIANIKKLGHDVNYIHCSSANFDRYRETHEGHDAGSFRRLDRSEFFAIAGEYEAIFSRLECHKYELESHGRDMGAFVSGVVE
jgi:thymidylate kinase